MTFRTKLWLVENLCVLESKKKVRFIGVYDGSKYLIFFGPEKYNVIYDRTTYIIGLKFGVTHLFSLKYAKIIMLILMIFYL